MTREPKLTEAQARRICLRMGWQSDALVRDTLTGALYTGWRLVQDAADGFPLVQRAAEEE